MTRVQDQRIWLAGGALVAVVVVALSWFLLVGPKLASAGDLEEQSLMSQQQNEILQVKTATLRVKSTRLDRYTSSLKAALASLPYDSGLPAFTRQIDAQARSAGVAVSSLTVGAVTPVDPVAPAADPAVGAAPSQSAPATTAEGLFSLQVTVQSSGKLRRQLAFIRTVRTLGPRQVLITSMQVASGVGAEQQGGRGSASVTSQMTIFVAPRTTAEIRELNKLANGDLER